MKHIVWNDVTTSNLEIMTYSLESTSYLILIHNQYQIVHNITCMATCKQMTMAYNLNNNTKSLLIQCRWIGFGWIC